MTAESGSQSILLVDDEPVVRKLVSTFLKSNGFDVIEAANGSEALASFHDPPKIGLLITDIVMPDMNGTELAQEILRLKPALPVLFISGFANEVDRLMPDCPCVSKPFRLDELLDQVNRCIRRVPPSQSLLGR